MSKTSNKASLSPKRLLLVFFWLLLLVFLVYGGSLSLSLYGDDWLVISKFFGNYGPGKQYSYFDQGVWLSNYGWQYIGISLLFSIFKFNSLPYYIVSLVLRAVTALSIYWLLLRITKNKQLGFVASSLFAISAIGAETTDWVYNMNSYLGIAIAIIGLGLLLTADDPRKTIRGLLLTIAGYIIVIIRLFILPFVVFATLFIKGFWNTKGKPSLPKAISWSLLGFGVFVLLKLLFPGLGLQPVNKQFLLEGLHTATEFIKQGKYDWLLTPFTSVGSFIFPRSVEIPFEAGLKIYPMSTFIAYAFILSFLSAFFVHVILKKPNLVNFAKVFFVNLFLLGILKIILIYHPTSDLRNFNLFWRTYFGIVFTGVTSALTWQAFRDKKKNVVLLYVVSIFFLFSFIFPWSYLPGKIFSAIDRYLIIPSVGMSILLGLYFLKSSESKMRATRTIGVIFISIIAIVQITASTRYFATQNASRGSVLNNKIFTQIKQEVPEIKTGTPSLFYFENVPNDIYEYLLRFGFGYHMQLYYNLPFDEKNHPFSVSVKENLTAVMTDDSYTKRLGITTIPEIDNIYAFRYENGGLVNITQKVRNYLTESN